MAKTAPTPPTTTPLSARAKRLARIRGDIHPHAPLKTHRPDSAATDSFLNSKRDKRAIKRSLFINKISKSTPPPRKAAAAAASGGIAKVRRKNKKLVTNLESLVDALPEVTQEELLNEGKVRHRSLGSRPGALKRKEKVVRGEMDRFGENMARLVGSGGGAKQSSGGGVTAADGKDKKKKGEEEPVQAASTGNRWAALRGYISMTMEQNPAFAGKQESKP